MDGKRQKENQRIGKNKAIPIEKLEILLHKKLLLHA